MTTRPPILVARAVFPETIAFLQRHFDVTHNQADEVWARPELIARLQGKAGVLTTGSERIAATGCLDVVDVLPVQLRNLEKKLEPGSRVALFHRDSMALGFADASYDQALLFFLLHEQPDDVRRRTLAEAFRVVKPGAIFREVHAAAMAVIARKTSEWGFLPVSAE